MDHLIKDISPKEVAKGFIGRYIHTASMTIGWVDVVKDAVLPEHSHLHEQITHVLEGKLQLTIGGETKVYEPGLVAVIPSRVVHSGLALTPCRVLDVFCPVREDYK